MIIAVAKDYGDHFESETTIKGNAAEIEAEVRSILNVIWREEHGPMIIDSALEQFVDWVKKH